MMDLVLVDAQQDDPHLPPEAQALVDAFFVPALERAGGRGSERIVVHALEIAQLVLERARWPEHGAQAAGDARLVVSEVALERGPPDALLGNPQVLQHFPHSERV